MAFHNQYSRPTPEQFAMIGEIITDAAVADLLLCNAVSRLAGMPDFLGLAVMERMTMAARAEALDRLLDVHHRRYHYALVSMEAVASGRAIMKIMAKLRDTRNDAAHVILFRSTDDGVFAFKPQGRQASYSAQTMPDTRLVGALSNDDLRRLTTELAQLVEMLEALLTMLPEVPEVLGPR